jgi:hypothetical protein
MAVDHARHGEEMRSVDDAFDRGERRLADCLDAVFLDQDVAQERLAAVGMMVALRIRMDMRGSPDIQPGSA